MAAIDSTATQATTKPAVPVVTSFPFNPLTTTFTRPADCDGLFVSTFLSGIDFSTSCLPKGFHTDQTSYFSPGLVCPTGYYSACHDNIGAKSITTVTCCPTFGPDVSLSCVTASTLRSVWSTLFCTWIAPEGDGTELPMTVSNNGITSTVTGSFTSPGGLNAFGIRMVYQRSDTQTTTMATRSRSTATTGTRPGGPGKTSDSASSDPSSGLGTGAKAAIGVVVPLVVLGLLAGFFIWWRKRQQYNRVVQSNLPTELHSHERAPPSELTHEGGMINKPYYVAEVPAEEPPAAELPAPLR
ncbi:transmembrane alpha-helix domain-containing [Trichoderma arundinaceum]|uniref:Transmembrane alpha-helix domain-containing n=1 Tax=Trichoderma arundinaceum TaxID=490622 RepID=A0A395NIP3_TRIAR|nr:transmembrane alpha-helix domain-containing [Trichoderma arundinaceum]